MSKIINSVKEIVSEVDKKVKRVYWTNEQIDKYFGKRPINEILSSGETCFMNPCSDLTIVSSYIMSRKKIPNNLIIEEHLPSDGFNFNRLHFVIEFQDPTLNEEYSLNYKRANEVYLLKGKYSGRKDLPLSKKIKLSGKKINPLKPIHEIFGYNTLESFFKEQFNGYSLESNILKLKKDNSLENYENYKNRFGEKFQIITSL